MFGFAAKSIMLLSIEDYENALSPISALSRASKTVKLLKRSMPRQYT